VYKEELKRFLVREGFLGLGMSGPPAVIGPGPVIGLEYKTGHPLIGPT